MKFKQFSISLAKIQKSRNTTNTKRATFNGLVVLCYFKPWGKNYFFNDASASVWGRISSANI